MLSFDLCQHDCFRTPSLTHVALTGRRPPATCRHKGTSQDTPTIRPRTEFLSLSNWLGCMQIYVQTFGRASIRGVKGSRSREFCRRSLFLGKTNSISIDQLYAIDRSYERKSSSNSTLQLGRWSCAPCMRKEHSSTDTWHAGGPLCTYSSYAGGPGAPHEMIHEHSANVVVLFFHSSALSLHSV